MIPTAAETVRLNRSIRFSCG